MQPPNRDFALVLTGLGQVAQNRGDLGSATRLLDQALHLQEATEPDPVLIGETEFALAEALWKTAKDRTRALLLARKARKACGDGPCPRRLAGLEEWLKSHDRGHAPVRLALH